MTSTSTRADWLVPAALIALSAVPMVSGGLRMAELASGAEVTPENARFFAAPLPVVVHILTATPYSILGALQFSAGLRRRKPGWHRASGRLLVPCGLAAALSGVWMTLFYDLPEVNGGPLGALGIIRLALGSAMAAFIVLGFAAIRRRDIARHRAWMMRGYAIGLGAGTQVLTIVPWLLLVGPVDETSYALTMSAGWAINMAVAEWVIRRGTTPLAAAKVGRGGSPSVI